MLTIFNRRELFVTFSEKTLCTLKSALADAGIPFCTKYYSPFGRMNGHARGMAFQNSDISREYKIYVHVNDYDRAFAAIPKAL